MIRQSKWHRTSRDREGGEMKIRADEFLLTACRGCGAESRDVFLVDIGNSRFNLCFACVLKLRDLCHEATCEKDVTGKCDCWEGEK